MPDVEFTADINGGKADDNCDWEADLLFAVTRLQTQGVFIVDDAPQKEKQ